MSQVIRDPLAKPLMGPPETKDTKVCGIIQNSNTSYNNVPLQSYYTVHVDLTHGTHLTCQTETSLLRLSLNSM